MPDELSIKSTLLGDMAAHQRLTGREVTSDDNDRLIVPELEKVDRLQADPPPQPRQMKGDEKPKWVVPNAHAKTRVENTGRPIPKVVDVPDEKTRVTVLSKLEGEFFERLNRRIELLMLKRDTGPLGEASWAERVESIILMKFEPTSPKGRQIELLKLAEASNETFGDWKKDLPKKLHFHATN